MPVSNQKNRWLHAVAVSALVVGALDLAACATVKPPANQVDSVAMMPPPPPPPPPPPSRPQHQQQQQQQQEVAQGEQVNQIVRYIGSDRSAWPETNKPRNFSDLYTRLIVTAKPNQTGALVEGGTTKSSDSTDSNTRSYKLERRNWLDRLFIRRTIHILEAANMQIREPDISHTVPLFSIDHDSARDTGDIFVTNYTSSDVQAPLFRIGPNTTLTIHLHEEIADNKKSSAASIVLQAVKTAVNIASPTSTVLTTRNYPPPCGGV